MRYPFVGELPALYRDVIGVFRAKAAKHGDRAPIHIGPDKAYVISNAEDAKTLLMANEAHARKSRYTAMMSSVFGGSVLTSSGETWKRQRDYLNALFRGPSLMAWALVIIKEAETLCETWADEAAGAHHEIFAEREAKGLVQRIMGRILFGAHFPDGDLHELMTELQRVNDRLFSMFIIRSVLKGPLSRLPVPGQSDLKSAVHKIDAFLEDLSRRSIDDDDPCLAAKLMKCVPDGAAGRKELRDQVTVLFYAGQDTTARAVAWGLLLLSEHPQWIARIREEAATALADPANPQLSKLTITDRVVREILRLKPPAYAIDRCGLTPEILPGLDIKPGAILPISVTNIHRSDKYWRDPWAFRPDRFLNGESAGRPTCAFIPFGHGARKCVGAKLAMMELTLVFAVICRDFNFKRVGDKPIKEKAAVTLGPSPDIRLRINEVKRDISHPSPHVSST
ncbi:MAG: cytochrome P450 [Pseudomonadota bacterium]